jgi:hypothetical protein
MAPTEELAIVQLRSRTAHGLMVEVGPWVGCLPLCAEVLLSVSLLPKVLRQLNPDISDADIYFKCRAALFERAGQKKASKRGWSN